MTDFIHEAPPPEGEKPSVPEKPVNERERQKRVYVYIAVLFTAAFILILWSFLSTHRSNQQVIDQLKGSTNLMQSTLERNVELEDEVKALEGEVDELEKTIAAQSDTLASYEEAAERNAAARWTGLLRSSGRTAPKATSRRGRASAPLRTAILRNTCPTRRFTPTRPVTTRPLPPNGMERS